MKPRHLIVFCVLVILCIVTFFIFEIGHIQIFTDDTMNWMFGVTIFKLACIFLLVFILWRNFSKRIFDIRNGLAKGFIWSLPCLILVLVSFPYSALISGEASITRTDLIPMFIVFILASALFEELLFRGFIISYIEKQLAFRSYQNIKIVLISAIIFALFRFTNLINGADILLVLFEVGYTFLLGCMYGTLYIKTKNIWICFLFHAIFDFGTKFVNYLGVGNPWDIVYWLLIAICGVGCAIYIVLTLLKMDNRNYMGKEKGH